ncbi:MAG TPA: cobyrinic acid a,c-diamide synthase, partial [Methanoregula sp.]|nr:cobyrinic acid a,c-diamide synthase [Methanoregula sp.]
LLEMGTVKALGAGCTCPAHSVVKALMRHLVVERNEVVILDMEAGIEHLGRGTVEHVDVLLAVADANQKSLAIAATICQLAQGSKIPTVGLVANRIATSRQLEIVRSFSQERHIPLLGTIPYDPGVAEAGMTGAPVDPAHSSAMDAIKGLAAALEAGHAG